MTRMEYKNFYTFLCGISEQYEKRTAVSDSNGIFTYEDLRNSIFGTVINLTRNGIRNKYIAVVSENSIDFLILALGAILSGNIIIPVGNRYSLDDMKYIITNSDTEIIAYSRRSEETVGLLGLNVEAVPIENLAVHGLPDEECSADFFRDENSSAMIVYTSGSEGKMNGVELSQKNILSSAEGHMSAGKVTGKTILTLPMNHMYCWSCGILLSLMCGCEIRFVSDMKYLFRELVTFAPDYLYLVPMEISSFHRMIFGKGEKSVGAEMLKHRAASVIGKNIRLLFTGGAPADNVLFGDFAEIGITVVNLYGTTECAPMICAGAVDGSSGTGIGKPIGCCEIKLDTHGDEPYGELLVRGDNVMIGYYKNPEKTKAVFEGEWYRTGDIAEYDSSGGLNIIGRVRNVLVLNSGENVSPEEYEVTFRAVREVRECQVYLSGGVLSADIYMYENAIQNEVETKINDLNKALPAYKRVESFFYLYGEPERTSINKIKRKHIIYGNDRTDSPKTNQRS